MQSTAMHCLQVCLSTPLQSIGGFHCNSGHLNSCEGIQYYLDQVGHVQAIWVVFNSWVSAVSPKVKSDCQKPLSFPESKRFPSLTPICRNLLILFSDAPEPCEQNKEYRLTESAMHEMKTLHRWCFEIATRSFPSKSVDNSEPNSTTDLHPLNHWSSRGSTSRNSYSADVSNPKWNIHQLSSTSLNGIAAFCSWQFCQVASSLEFQSSSSFCFWNTSMFRIWKASKLKDCHDVPLLLHHMSRKNGEFRHTCGWGPKFEPEPPQPS